MKKETALLISLLLLLWLLRKKLTKSSANKSKSSMPKYEELKALVQNEPLPLMIVDLEVLDANIRNLAKVARASGKKLRVASKSVRVPALLKRILEVGGDLFQGVMCFCVPEAVFLEQEGFSDLLVAYPTVQRPDLEQAWTLTQNGSIITLMVDCPAHLMVLDAFWKEKSADHDDWSPLCICIDVDMSYRSFGQHLGVQRSPIRSVEDLKALLTVLKTCEHLKLDGIMGYEAQIAGLGETSPFSPMLNQVKTIVKTLSIQDVFDKRKKIDALVRNEGFTLRFFNGGGTGSIQTTTKEPWLTEVTAGSGFLQSFLFDFYHDNMNNPAFYFGLQMTRRPQDDIVTCQSGGFVASGEVGEDKQPLPFLPKGLRLTSREASGEVQTPLEGSGATKDLDVGDPVFFRPAKAGEIAERFNEYVLKEGTQVVGRVKTYRGFGKTFY